MRGASMSPVAPRRPQTQTEGASGNKTCHNCPKELSRSREVLRTGVPGHREAGHEPWQATAMIHVYAVLPALWPELLVTGRLS